MSCTSTAPDNYGASKWIAGQLPIIYTLSNTKWPVNTEDSEDFFHTVAQSGGYAQLELAGTYETYVNKEYVQITDATVDGYNGVWQIREIVDSQTIVINAPFLGAANGTVQRYYENYHLVIRVYTGIPTGHYLESERPMSLRTTLRFRPDSSNEVEADVGSVVRSDLAPIQSRLCDILEAGETVGNDWYNWTALYIAYAESYDVSDGSTVSNFTSTFVNDTDGGDINYLYASNSTRQFRAFTGWSMGEYVLADYNVLLQSKFLTNFSTPTYFLDNEFDVSILNDFDSTDLESYEELVARVIEKDVSGNTLATTDLSIPNHDKGLYRIALSEHTFNASTKTFTLQCIKINNNTSSETNLSEVLNLKLDSTACGPDPVYLKWQNYLGGWDHWLFYREVDYLVDVGDRQRVRRDITADWDTTFRTGDTEDDYIYTEAYEGKVIRSSVLTNAEMDVINKWLRISNKVLNPFFANDAGCGNFSQKTVLVEGGSFTVRQTANRFNEVSLEIRDTNRLRLPRQ